MKLPVQEADVPWEPRYGATEREIRGKALCDLGGESAIGVGLHKLLTFGDNYYWGDYRPIA